MRFGVLICCFILCFALADAQTAPLPLDFSPGLAPQENCFDGDERYSDPSITVEVRTGRMFNCDYWVADIRVAHASQLRTAAAHGFKALANEDGRSIAKKANAVLAVNGDFYSHPGSKYVLRQGTFFADTLKGRRDILLIDEDGDFHVLHKAEKGSVDGTADGKAVVNALGFGPILVEDGKAIEEFSVTGIAPDEGRQRVAIAQAGPLRYKVFCCAGPIRGSKGMTIGQFAALAESEHVRTAYNLDGGDSAMLYFHGRKLNDRTKTSREISDIVYFASAWDGEEED